MKRTLFFVVFCACGDEGPSSFEVTTTFPVTTMFGTGTSYLQKYIGQDLSFEISFPSFRTEKYMSTDDCANTDAHLRDAPRVAKGATATDAQVELLDPLDQDWTVSFELCEDPTRSIVSIDSVIDPYNLSIGCGAVPETAQQFGDDGFPVIADVTAMRCYATILDVVNAYTVGNADFTLTVEVD